MDRKGIALKHVDPTGRGLEIGPSYAPLVPKASGARIEVVDHADQAELVAKYRSYGLDETLLSRIEEVDYLWSGGSLLDVIPERGIYDYVVASHLVEHTVDLIGFLQDCESLLNDDGRLALVVPDKRFCFDRFQPLSSIGMVIDAHHAGAAFHPAGSLVDHQAYACKRGDASLAWTAADDSALSLQFPNLEGAQEAIAAGLSQQDYHDIHRWRFIPASFRLLIHDLRALEYHAMSIVGFHDTIGHEFFVTLGKEGSPEEIDRLAALRDIESGLASTVDQEANAVSEHPKHVTRPVNRWVRRLGLTRGDRALVDNENAQRSNPGWCACCRADTEFVEVGAWLRDQYVCGRCHSIPRQRAVNLVLDSYFPAWEDSTLHESSPSNDFIGRYARHYSRSYFFDDVPLGQEREGDRCEDLERLTFDDETFDLFVTQDVLEHVLRPDRAVREIMRVLKTHGAHIFTTPKHKDLIETRQRVSIESGAPVHLLEAEYHGNPIGDGRALVTWDYGDDFEQCLLDWCGHPTVTYVTRDRARGLDGEYLEVFVTRKVGRPNAG